MTKEKGNQTTTDKLIEEGKRGVTNSQMIEALKKHKDIPENWDILFKQYPDVFISTAKYLPPELRTKAVTLIQTVFPNYTIQTKSENRLRANIETVQKMIADKTDKEKVVDFIISNRKGDIKKILMEVL